MIWTDIDGIRCALSDRYHWLYFNWHIICFNPYNLIKVMKRVKGHQVQFQNHPQVLLRIYVYIFIG